MTRSTRQAKIRPQNRKIARRDHEVIQRLKPLLKGRSLREVARQLGVNPGSITQVMQGDVYYCAALRRAFSLRTLPAWKNAPGVPLTHISGGELRQCPDCILEYEQGDKAEADTWHWMNVKSRKRCEVHARQRRNRRAASEDAETDRLERVG
jgi:hypothetical protein